MSWTWGANSSFTDFTFLRRVCFSPRPSGRFRPIKGFGRMDESTARGGPCGRFIPYLPYLSTVDTDEMMRAVLEFLRTARELAPIKVQRPWGTVYRDDRFPLIHQANLAWVSAVPDAGHGCRLRPSCGGPRADVVTASGLGASGGDAALPGHPERRAGRDVQRVAPRDLRLDRRRRDPSRFPDARRRPHDDLRGLQTGGRGALRVGRPDLGPVRHPARDVQDAGLRADRRGPRLPPRERMRPGRSTAVRGNVIVKQP